VAVVRLDTDLHFLFSVNCRSPRLDGIEPFFGRQFSMDWRRPVGRPRATWLRTIHEDVQALNFGVHTAWRKARDRDTWHQVVSTATLC